MSITDNGPKPNAFDIESATKENPNYRTVAWTGKYLQVTLMSIPVGSSIGLEVGARRLIDHRARSLDPGAELLLGGLTRAPGAPVPRSTTSRSIEIA